jgi:hypothetical protein
MAKQTVIAQKPRPTTTKFIHASRHFILNPENRVRHDPKAYEEKQVCESCKQEKPYVEFNKIFGMKASEPLDKKYSKVCKLCFKKKSTLNFVYRYIDKSDKTDIEKAQLKLQADKCILQDGLDILRTCRTLGIQLKPDGTKLSLKEAGKRASEVMAKVALAKGLAKSPIKVPPKVPAKKGTDISSDQSTESLDAPPGQVSARQLAAHVKTMSFIKK